MSETTATLQRKEVIVPIEQVTVVGPKHPLAAQFFTPRNLYKPNQDMMKTIAQNGRPDYPVLLWPYKADDDSATEFICIDGNQRTINTKAAGLATIPAEIRQDWTMAEAIQAAARLNSQRQDNDFSTDCLLAVRLTQPDKVTLAAKGMSYPDAGVQFNKSHTWVRNHVKMQLFFPAVIKQAIQNGKLPYTVAEVALLKQEILRDKEALLAKYEEIMKDGGAIENSTGKPGKARTPKVKDVSTKDAGLSKNEWRLIAQAADTPADFALLIEIFIGDKAFDAGEANGLDWLTRPSAEAVAAAAGKGKGKAKKEEKAPGKSKAPGTIDAEDLGDFDFE